MKRIIVAATVISVLIGTMPGCWLWLTSPEDDTDNDNEYEDYEVAYVIEGTASTVDVTLNNSGGNTEQYSDVSVPTDYTYTTFDDWFVYVSAQNQGESGSVTVKIYHYGSVIEQASSSGEYVIATASGDIGDY
jgi:hypothetical protein